MEESIQNYDFQFTAPKVIFLNEVFKKIDINPQNIDICPWNSKKTQHCKHQKSCTHNIIMGTLNGFINSITFKFVLRLFKKLYKFSKQKKDFLINMLKLFHPKRLKDGLFLAKQNLIIKLITCLSRRYFQCNLVIIDIAAGFLAGYASYNDMPHQLIFYSLVSKLFEMSIDYLDQKGYIKKNRWTQLALCYILSIFSLYYYVAEPKYINRVIYNIYANFSKLNHNLFAQIKAIGDQYDRKFFNNQ